MWSFKNIVLCLLIPCFGYAQDDNVMEQEEELVADSVAEQVEVLPLFSSAAIVFDYGKLVGLALDTETKYEIGAQVDIKDKLLLIGEFGIATLTPNGAYVNTNYISEGSYFRVGLGYKINMNAKNNILFSLRYAKSTYSDKGTIDIKSSTGIFDTYNEPFEREEISAYWYEAVLSSETRLWKGLYAGFHIRLRVMGDYDKQLPLDVFSIPGYGRTFDKTIPAFNLYIKYALERL
jgi:hypothetical protein